MSTNLHIFLTPFTHESRVLKESKSLIEASLFDEVLVAALWKDGLKEHESIDEHRHVWRIPLSTRRFPRSKIVNQLKYAEWIIRMMWGMRAKNITVVQSHSLPALLPGILFKWFWQAKLVYDAHELETECNGLRGLRKYVYKIVESCLIAFADAVIVVSDSIADWYNKKYSISRPFVIKNIPHIKIPIVKSQTLKTDYNLKNKFNLINNEILFIYQGGLFKGRGIEIILDAFANSDRDKHIVFMGYGDLEEKIKNYQNRYCNIHFHSAVKPEELLKYTNSTDVGISLIENTCLSYYFCLPNKLFEYLIGGLPVIVSNFPEMSRIIDSYECGWKVDVENQGLRLVINSINHETLEQKKQNAQLAKESFGWHIEELTLIKIYQQL